MLNKKFYCYLQALQDDSDFYLITFDKVVHIIQMFEQSIDYVNELYY